MVEQLSELMRDEASRIAVPVPPAAAVLTEGRRLRRRRRLAAAASAAAAVAAIAGGALLVTGQGRGPDDVAFSVDAYRGQGALAVDNKLYVAGHHIPFDRSVKSFYYTGIGVVVRSGTSPWTDDADVDHYTLVTGDGNRKELDLKTHDRVVSTEPDSGRLAYAEPAPGGKWAVVVSDVTSGRELDRTVVKGRFTWGGWEAPPVSLDGDLVWVHFDGGWTEVDWRTGEVREVPGTRSVSEIANGNYATVHDGTWTIRSMEDGAVVSTVDVGKDTYGFFSPDGRFIRFFDQMTGLPGAKPSEPFVYDVRTGARTPLPGGRDVGWTPDGDLLALTKDGTVEVCIPGTGACQPTGLVMNLTKDSTIKLGGNPYES
jgi:hypothetical protein